MATVSFANLDQRFDMREDLLAAPSGTEFIRTGSIFAWFSPDHGVAFMGSGYTYDVNGLPEGGTISWFRLDLDGDSATLPEVKITGLHLPFSTLKLVMASQPATVQNDVIWRALLSGNDTINFSSATTREIAFAGDGCNLGFGPNPGEVYGGDDVMIGPIGGNGFVSGDFFSTNVQTFVYGGDDTITVSDTGLIAGDVSTVLGFLQGGDDTLAGNGAIYGDAAIVETGATVHGGDDTITAGGPSSRLVGDAMWVSGALYGGNDEITGSSGRDTIYGDAEAVWDDAFVRGGNDVLRGGDGNDAIYGDWYRYGLEAVGGNDLLYGEGGNDELVGNNGDDLLDGGAGADKMYGGKGDDLYVVDNVNDFVLEDWEFSDGVDTVNSSVTFGLQADGGVENLTLTGSAAINATGNVLANILIGNSAANILDGGGGADTMRGGAGNDTYVIDNIGDVVDETGATGSERIVTSFTASLLDTLHFKGSIEAIELRGDATANITGNALDNLMLGNNGANIINGHIGADVMQGRAGDDTYIVDNAGDVVSESVAGSSGIDLVRSCVNFSLVNGSQSKGYVENVSLFGSGNIFAYGNSLGNELVGNSGANTLAGGLGTDVLTGGAGNDVFLFNTSPDAYGYVPTNMDRITDMNESGNDTIHLENAIFTRLAAGALAAGAFRISTTGAVDADDRIIYDNVSGHLYYDPYGNASDSPFLIARLDTGLALTAADFFVV